MSTNYLQQRQQKAALNSVVCIGNDLVTVVAFAAVRLKRLSLAACLVGPEDLVPGLLELGTTVEAEERI